ncbi:MAG: hypothetical protein J6A72_07940 [Alistipes sp.]|nr:hypothetical protein [Alistipes sp.]
MRFLNRLFCLICVAFACGSCVESVTLSYEEMEAIALEEWIKIHRPELINNYQPNGGYYVEILDEGVADSVPVRYHNAWLWFDVTCRDLAGNVVLTRNSELARMQDSYTDYTHYVPYFLFCGEENSSSLPEGTYLSMRNKLNIGGKEYSARYGTKMRLYLPSSVAAGDDGLSGDGGYEGQYKLDANRPMIADITVWGHVTNPVEYEDKWVRAFAEANGGLAPIPENKEEAEEQSRLRRSYMRPMITRGDDSEESTEKEEVVYDNQWHMPVDSIAGLYVNYLYTPKQQLEYNCLRQDTLMYAGQTEYKIGKIYGTKSLAQINQEIDKVLLKKFGEGLHPADAEPADSVSIADVWYVARLLDGFVIDTNIPEIKKIVYGNDYEESVTDEATPIEFSLNEDDTSDSSYVDAWNYAIPHLKLGAWNAILTVSSNAYGATGVTGSSSSSSGSSYYDYYNYYNYYNSYYGNSYYNNYYNGYYGGMGGMMGGYGGYGGYYNNYYDSYYYNNLYNNSYGMSEEEESGPTITTEVLPYTPLIWQVYVEPRDKSE